MALDLAKIRALVDQLETENAEAIAAGEELAVKTEASVSAAGAAQVAGEAYKKESEEAKAKIAELVTELQAALSQT